MKKPDHDRGITRHKPQLCLHCGYLFDSAGTADGRAGRRPQAGDMTVCMNCAEVSAFETSDTLRKLTPAEQTLLATDPDWEETRDAQARLREMMRHGFKTTEAERRRGKPQ